MIRMRMMVDVLYKSHLLVEVVVVVEKMELVASNVVVDDYR